MDLRESSVGVDPQINRIMQLSTRVEGYVELQTLSKIEATLRNSTILADIELAHWIQKNYLFQPVGEFEDGRPVQGRDGFERLNHAYKRVRLLTNRAQDKWPFFDRYWKKFPASTVHQASQDFPTSNSMLHNPHCLQKQCPVVACSTSGFHRRRQRHALTENRSSDRRSNRNGYFVG
jgi:hypothetical protein